MIHPSAIVDDGACVGQDTMIWQWVHVCAGASIGQHGSLGQGVYVGPGVQIGHGVRVQNHVSIFAGVVLEDDVFVGPSAVFTNVSTPRAFHPRRDALETTRVCRGASIGANATIVCGTTVGRYAMIGAGAVVTKNVAAHALMIGVPARQDGWVCTCGLRLSDTLGCTCGRRFFHSSDGLEEFCE